MNTKKVIILVAAAALLAAGACKSKPKDAAPAAGTPELSGAAAVKTVPVVREKIAEKLSYTGTLEAWQKINITPETGGKIARILVEEGQRVAKDQVLAELDTKSIDLQAQQAQAALSVADANHRNAARNKERMDRLLAEKAVSDSQYEQVKLAYDAAKAQLEQAQAAVNLARHAQEVAVMRAPWNGIIASKNAEVGDILNPMMGGYGGGGAGGVVTLVDYSRIKIAVEVSQNDIARIRRGQPAVLRLSDGDIKEYSGTVTVVNSTADPLGKKFRVEVAVANPLLILRPGTFGTVVFEVESHDNALAIPQKAVLDNQYVFVVVDGKAVKKQVRLGLKNTTLIEVLDGLNEGDAVISEGNYGLMNGSPVEVKR